jgi:hypothetical protein
MRHPPETRSARVRSAAASLPASGSVRASAMSSRPATRRGSSSAFRAALP